MCLRGAVYEQTEFSRIGNDDAHQAVRPAYGQQLCERSKLNKKPAAAGGLGGLKVVQVTTANWIADHDIFVTVGVPACVAGIRRSRGWRGTVVIGVLPRSDRAGASQLAGGRDRPEVGLGLLAVRLAPSQTPFHNGLNSLAVG